MFSDEQGDTHPVNLGLNPIAIDPDDDWVYFSTMNPGNLFRIETEILGDFTATNRELSRAIEIYGTKPSSDGIAAGEDGRVYVTNVNKNGIDIVTENETFDWVRDENLIWPDGLYIAPDGDIIATVNQLHLAPVFNAGQSAARKPYLIVRITGDF